MPQPMQLRLDYHLAHQLAALRSSYFRAFARAIRERTDDLVSYYEGAGGTRLIQAAQHAGESGASPRSKLDLLEGLEREHEELVRESMERFEVEAFVELVERERRELMREVEGLEGLIGAVGEDEGR